jgi:hypothetical protein
VVSHETWAVLHQHSVAGSQIPGSEMIACSVSSRAENAKALVSKYARVSHSKHSVPSQRRPYDRWQAHIPLEKLK